MPIERMLVARNEQVELERVVGAPDGRGWGQTHESHAWRCVLPGIGQVKWRSEDDFVFADPLTAFQIGRRETYQLNHDGGRAHFVLCSKTPVPVATAARAWVVPIRHVYALRVSCQHLAQGQTAVHAVAAAVHGALAHAQPLRASSGASTVLRAREFMAHNLARRLSLEVVGEQAHCSPFKLNRLFREHLRTTPHRYLVELRLATALQRMQEGERDLAGLAHDLGFSTQSHFGDVFRRAVGCTPAAARRALACAPEPAV